VTPQVQKKKSWSYHEIDLLHNGPHGVMVLGVDLLQGVHLLVALEANQEDLGEPPGGNQPLNHEGPAVNGDRLAHQLVHRVVCPDIIDRGGHEGSGGFEKLVHFFFFFYSTQNNELLNSIKLGSGEVNL